MFDMSCHDLRSILFSYAEKQLERAILASRGKEGWEAVSSEADKPSLGSGCLNAKIIRHIWHKVYLRGKGFLIRLQAKKGDTVSSPVEELLYMSRALL